jgi:uncharacterized protein (UPF0335 family)
MSCGDAAGQARRGEKVDSEGDSGGEGRTTTVGGIDSRRLKSFVARIEHVQGDLDALNEDKTEIYREAKSDGFDTNVIKALIRRRRNGKGATQEADALLALYERALEGEEESGPPSRRRGRRLAEREDNAAAWNASTH